MTSRGSNSDVNPVLTFPSGEGMSAVVPGDEFTLLWGVEGAGLVQGEQNNNMK